MSATTERLLRTNKGMEVKTTLTNDEAVAIVAKLEGNSFALSLCQQLKNRGLTDNQWAWMHKLAMERQGPGEKDKDAAMVITRTEVEGITKLFKQASEHLKNPRIRLMLWPFADTNQDDRHQEAWFVSNQKEWRDYIEWLRVERKDEARAKLVELLVNNADQSTIARWFAAYCMEDGTALANWAHIMCGQKRRASSLILRVAGPRSKYHGDILIVQDGTNDWWGRITKDGQYIPPHNAQFAKGTEKLDQIITLLDTFALDPESVSGLFGRLLGRCCYCGRGLEDERSTEVGYGPVCANKWNLPWGNKE